VVSEDYAIVLDYLATGKSASYKSEPIVQLIGTESFTLLEAVPKKSLKILDKVYIGKDKRDEIDFIKRRVAFKELTSTAAGELSKVVKQLVLEKKEKYLEFYNKCGAITIKRHQLELIPGLGKKHMQDILKQRQIKPFESFEDITERVKLMPDPVQAIVKRIIEELEAGDIKYYLFVRPPAQLKPEFKKRY